MEDQNLPNASGDQNLIKEISLPIFQSKTWLKLLGVVMIIMGIIQAISIFGIIICWLPIWLGVLLFQSASAIENAQFTGNKAELLKSLNKLKMYFMINGILMLLILIFIGVAMLISGGAMFSLMNNT